VRAFVEESEINTADKAKENIMKRLKALGYL
jgi:hypothetical protein